MPEAQANLSILGFFKTRPFQDLYSVYFFVSKNIAVQRRSLEYVLPDMLRENKKEYQNIVGWFNLLLCFVVTIIIVLQSYLPGLSTRRNHLNFRLGL